MTLDQALVVFSIIAVGYYLYIRIAKKERPESWHLGTFFLGGRNIGAALTEHASWGTSFALGNGIFFFAYLGYTWGWGALWVQVPWCLGMAGLAVILPMIIRETSRHTLHGFLGDLYEGRTRLFSSLVTSTGFVLNLGFELFIGATLIAGILGKSELELPVVIGLAILGAAYCDIGGFRANARTDRWQNRIGIGALLILIFLLWNSTDSATTERVKLGALFDFTKIPTFDFVSMCLYAFLVQFVDMSNWQNIAANSFEKAENLGGIKRAFVKSAVWSFFFPGVFCVLLGFLLKSQSGLEQADLLPAALSTVLGGVDIWATVFTGLFLFAFLGTMSSSADTFLMATIQTISWDVQDHDKVKSLGEGEDAQLEPEDEERIVNKARRNLYALSIVAGLLFYGCTKVTDQIFAIQFIIWGAALSLGPAVFYGLLLRKKKKRPSDRMKVAVFVSVVAGYIGGIAPIVISFFGSSINIYATSPVAAFGASLLVFCVGYVVSPAAEPEPDSEPEEMPEAEANQ